MDAQATVGMTEGTIGKCPEQPTNQNRNNGNNRLLRLPQIIGQKEVSPEQAEVNRQSGKSPKTPRRYIQPLIPVSRASWWNGVKEGKYPQPMKLGSRTTVWRESDVVALVQQFDEVI